MCKMLHTRGAVGGVALCRCEAIYARAARLMAPACVGDRVPGELVTTHMWTAAHMQDLPLYMPCGKLQVCRSGRAHVHVYACIHTACMFGVHAHVRTSMCANLQCMLCMIVHTQLARVYMSSLHVVCQIASLPHHVNAHAFMHVCKLAI